MSPNPLLHHRGAGVLVSLASLRSATDCGIGDLHDLRLFIDWTAQQGLSLLQLLPVSPISPTAPFPYSAYSAWGLDLTVISLAHVPDAEQALRAETEEIAELRQAPRLVYERLYMLKTRVLRAAFQQFQKQTDQTALNGFIKEEEFWLHDYALFTALKAQRGWRVDWKAWTSANDADVPAEEIRFHQYVQWIAHIQWQETLAYAHQRKVYLMGDMPIYVGGDSVDVWAKHHEFDLEADGGAPPDYFNWLGQNWAAPLYAWDVMAADGFAWWKARIAYNTRLFDWLRFDHFRGVSEYWRIPKRPAILDEIERETEIPRVAKEYEKVAWFWPIKFQFQFREKMPYAQWETMTGGERLDVIKHINAEWRQGPGDAFVNAMLDASTRARGTGWVVEDLGADMDAVFALRDRMGLPGMRVVQFFGYEGNGKPNLHVDPRTWPEHTLGMTDTHDLPPLRAWVQSLSDEERGRIAAASGMYPPHGGISWDEFEFQMMGILFASPARWVMTSLQTLLRLGAEDRLNWPGTVGPQNWTWRLPMNLEDLPDHPILQGLIRHNHRLLD